MKLLYEILVINDYPPWMWTDETRRWLKDYVEACSRYFEAKLNLTEKIEFTIEISQTSFPRDRVEGGYLSVDDTLNPLGESALQAGYNAVILLTKHKGWWHKNNPQATYFNSWEKMGWSYVLFYPDIEETKFYKALLPFCHEIAHQILYALGDSRNLLLDKPPYVALNEQGINIGITEYLFEAKYPMQWI